MKKNISDAPRVRNKRILKFLIMSKCILLLVIISSLQGFSKSYSQDKISIKLRNVSLQTALKEITKQSDYRFLYSDAVLKGFDSKVNLEATDASINQIVSQVLANSDLSFKVNANLVIITKPVAIAIPIKGKVTDNKGVPMPGVTVFEKANPTNAVVTDSEGNYTISVADRSSVVVVRYVGFITQEITAGAQSTINFSLVEEIATLNEVVVVGYGTQKRSTVTAAISSVNSKTLNELPVAGVTQALQGRVAGLNVVNNGNPGSEPIITIRGVSSINSSNTPLYVVDGFPTGSINSFDPKDIESIEVLKDASSAAIYGSRGTNGVIIITTKKATGTQRPQVSYDSYVGVQNVWKKIDLMNTAQYLQYERALNGAAGNAVPPRLLPANFNQPIYAGATQTFAQTNTNWQDEYFKKNALIQQQSVSLSGGSPANHYYLSAGYFSQDAVAKNVGYNRINLRMNSDYKISNVFTFGENATISQGIQKTDAGGSRSPLANVIRMQPYLPVYNPTTTSGFFGPLSAFDGSDPTNPVEMNAISDRFNNNFKILANAFLNVKIAPWLTFRTSYGVDYTNSRNFTYTPISSDGGTIVNQLASINNSRNTTVIGLATHQLTFDKTFGQHHVNAVAVYEQQNINSTSESGSGQQSNNTVRTLTGATNLIAGYNYQENVLQSMVGRISYDYEGKYLLNASLRRDGSSSWAPGNNYQSFPAASIGWRVDREAFLVNSKAISELKLRAGYGVTGINATSVGNYTYLVNEQTNNGNYPFNNVFTIGNTSFYNGIANPGLLWETTKQIDAGFDLGLFQNKFTLSFDYYLRKTDNLMLGAPTAPSQGYGGGSVTRNIGKLQNNGVDIQATYNKREGDFKWSLSGVFGLARNKVVALNNATASLPDGNDPDFGGGNTTNTTVGQSIGYFYGFITEGIYQNAAEVAAHAVQVPTAAPGDIKFKDVNGDGIVNDNDRVNIGSYLPKFTYSLNYSANYKGFDGSIYFQGSQGNQIFNGTRILTEGMARLFNASPVVLNAWTPTNTNTTIPRAINGNPALNARVSDRWVEDGSYLRLKNVIVGYTFPATSLGMLKKVNLSKLRLYVSSQNLLTFTKYKGFDPEISGRGGNRTNGIDYGQYPSVRSFQFGLQATF